MKGRKRTIKQEYEDKGNGDDKKRGEIEYEIKEWEEKNGLKSRKEKREGG